MPKTVAFFTLGCKLNFAESSDLKRKFEDASYQVVDFKDKADVYVINTCTVTAMAEKKGRTAIRQAVKMNPQAIVAVVGCFSQLRADEIKTIEGVDFILGNNEKHDLLDYIAEYEKKKTDEIPDTTKDLTAFRPSHSSDDRTRTFLKIQDGCDYFCTYCAIPYARGHNRSDTIANTVKVAEQIAKKGVKEIILTGVNIGEFGKQNDENFFELIKALDKVEGIERYRISSIEPNLLTDEIIDFVAESSAFLPHFHIPLQAGTDKILTLMKRKYQRDLFADRVKKIKKRMPHAFIAADVIVGFPGETEADFESAYQFIDNLPLAYLHIFPYSERPNTLASKMPDKVSAQDKKKRVAALSELSEKKHKAFYESSIGQKSKVLWESDVKDGYVFGFTEHYIRVKTLFDKQMVNQIQDVELKSLDKDGIFKI